MTIFITQGRYSRDAIKGLLANPEDRSEVVAKLIAAAGGKMLAYYVTLGETDFLVISEMPSHKEASQVAVIAAAAGGVTDIRTTVAMTTAEAKEMFRGAGAIAAGYRPPGG